VPARDGFGSSGRRELLRYDPRKALSHLRRVDADLARLIRRVGPFRMESRAHLTTFQVMLRSIVYQQLSGRAAGAIEGRLKALFPNRRPTPAVLLTLADHDLRACGLSLAKIRALKDLAERSESGALPHRQRLRRMDDEAVIDSLCQVRGIGRWSAQMLLMFHLGRPDVLPVADLGVRKGFMLHRRDGALPSPDALLAHGERWRPFRSVASWYLWRATELSWTP
jgi:3-methyladenine DNA glycosylase/8-oxoguanine DNA glycosylase